MKRLNFYPYYRQLLVDRVKTTTLRLKSAQSFESGEDVILSVGWPETGSLEDLHGAKIERVYLKRIRDLGAEDLRGESPDCITQEAVPYVLGAIYRRMVHLDDEVSVIKFCHN
jgi:hypothetical protein